MKIKTVLLSALLCFVLLPSAFAQRFEIGGFVGGQLNGGVDLSTSLFRRIDVQNSVNYGVTAGYLLGEYFGLEFQWNHNGADTVAQPVVGGSEIKVFTLDQNQYHGQFSFSLHERGVSSKALCLPWIRSKLSLSQPDRRQPGSQFDS